MKKLLIVIDYQQDFVAGMWGFGGATLIMKAIVNKIREYRSCGGDVFFTMDTHGIGNMSSGTLEQLTKDGIVPVNRGVKLYGRVHDEVKPEDIFFVKNTYGSQELLVHLAAHRREYDSIEFVGVQTEVCVLANVVLAMAALPDIQLIVDRECVAGGDDELERMALRIMENMGVRIL